jgi:FAD binding domain
VSRRTTTTFIEGGCIWTEFGGELHDAFSGGQLDAAVAFRSAHRGEVSPVTVSLWGNDVREFVRSCPDFACVERDAPLFIAHLTSNLALILTRLRTAAPDAEIIVTGAWDSYLDALPVADPLFQLSNTSTGLVLGLWLTSLGVRVRIVDKTEQPGTTSRALAVQARTLELYRQIGIADAVVALDGQWPPSISGRSANTSHAQCSGI